MDTVLLEQHTREPRLRELQDDGLLLARSRTSSKIGEPGTTEGLLGADAQLTTLITLTLDVLSTGDESALSPVAELGSGATAFLFLVHRRKSLPQPFLKEEQKLASCRLRRAIADVGGSGDSDIPNAKLNTIKHYLKRNEKNFTKQADSINGQSYQ